MARSKAGTIAEGVKEGATGLFSQAKTTGGAALTRASTLTQSTRTQLSTKIEEAKVSEKVSGAAQSIKTNTSYFGGLLFSKAKEAKEAINNKIEENDKLASAKN